MPFEKGRNKTGGRKKGVPNKDISTFKAALKTGLIERLGDFFNLLDSENLPEKDRINAYLKALEFVMPKQQKLELDADMTTNLIQVKFESTKVLPIHDETEFIDD